MGEISEALKRAKVRGGDGPRDSNSDSADDNADNADNTANQVVDGMAAEEMDGLAALMRAERERAGSSTSPPQSGSAVPDSRARPTSDTARSDSSAPAQGRDVFTIPETRTGHWASRVVAVAPESQFAVRFRHLAIRTRSDLASLRRSSLLVTSAVPGEGKTTVSINLALAMSSIASESSIALVDFDLRRARIAVTLECEVELGIEEVLAGRANLSDARIPTNFQNLDLFPVAKPERAPHETLGNAAAAAAIDELHSKYDYVIFDGPPVLPVPDVPLVEPKIGGCLLVVRSRRTRHSALAEMMELLPRRSIIGVFMNDAIAKRDRNPYGYYGQDFPGTD